MQRRKSFDSVSPGSQCPQHPIISSAESIDVMLLIDSKMLRSNHRGRITRTDSTAQRLQCQNVQAHPVRGIERPLPKRHSRIRRASVGSSALERRKSDYRPISVRRLYRPFCAKANRVRDWTRVTTTKDTNHTTVPRMVFFVWFVSFVVKIDGLPVITEPRDARFYPSTPAPETSTKVTHYGHAHR